MSYTKIMQKLMFKNFCLKVYTEFSTIPEKYRKTMFKFNLRSLVAKGEKKIITQKPQEKIKNVSNKNYA